MFDICLTYVCIFMSLTSVLTFLSLMIPMRLHLVNVDLSTAEPAHVQWKNRKESPRNWDRFLIPNPLLVAREKRSEVKAEPHATNCGLEISSKQTEQHSRTLRPSASVVLELNCGLSVPLWMPLSLPPWRSGVGVVDAADEVETHGWPPLGSS